MLLDPLRQRPWMLDHLPVHVQNVKATVRSISKLYRAKPVVGGGEKLGASFFLRPFTLGNDSVSIFQQFAMDEITACISNECISTKALTEGIAPVNGNAGCGGKVSRDSPASLNRTSHLRGNPPTGPDDSPRFVGTYAKHFRSRTIHRDAQPRVRHGISWICSIAGIVDDGLQMIAVA